MRMHSEQRVEKKAPATMMRATEVSCAVVSAEESLSVAILSLLESVRDRCDGMLALNEAGIVVKFERGAL